MANAGIAFDNFEDKETGEKISLAEIMSLPGIVAQASVTLTNYDALKATDARSTVLVGGRNKRGDVGAGVFSFIEGDQSASVSGDTGEGIWVAPASDTTGASGAWKRSIDGEIDSRWYAFGDSGSDNKTIAQQACEHSEKFNTPVVFHGERVYPMTVQRPPFIKGKLVAAPGFPLSYNQYLLDVRGNGVRLDIEVDLSGLIVSGIQVQNRCKGSVYVHNQGAGLQADAGLQNCLYMAGTGNEFDSVRIHDQADGIDANDSIPRCVASQSHNTVKYLEMVDANSGWISGGEGVVIGEVYAKNVRDNPIYCLGFSGENTFWSIGSMTCIDCPDEPIVVSHGGYCTVGSLSLYNSGRVNVQGSTLLIGSMFVDQKTKFLSDGRRVGTLLGVRKRQSGDPENNRLHVGTLTGTAFMTDTQAGSCIYGCHPDEKCDFSFGTIALKIIMVSDSSNFFMTAVRGKVNGGSMMLHVVDPDGVTTTGPRFISFIEPGKGYGASGIGSLQVTNETSGEIRAQHLIGNDSFHFVPANLQVRTDIGPYATFPSLRANTVPRPRLSLQGSGAPSTGGYIRGDRVYNQFPANGGKVGWVCTSSGSPGTWKTFGAIDA